MSNELKGPVTEMVERLGALEQDAAKCREEYLRALADFDNFRKRVERDLVVTQRLVLEGFVKELLPALDSFERALLVVSGEPERASVQKGIELIHRQLCEVLARHGLSRYSCVGQSFDPRRAEAVSFVESGEHEPNVVVAEVCAGYECEGRVLRPARVVVARRKPAGPPEVSEAGGDAGNQDAGV